MERHKQMAAMSAKQRDRFAERGIEHPVSTFLPPATPSKKKAAKRASDPSSAAVAVVIDRDGSCVVCGEIRGDERGTDWSVHHRKLRSRGGDNRLSNLVLVCGNGTLGCHSDIHGGPVAAERAGWMVPSTADPTSVVMAHKQYGYVLLDNSGGLAPVDAPEVDHG